MKVQMENEIEFEECPECGEQSLYYEDVDYEVIYKCNNDNCEYEGSDSYIDLYGCMSVPWGGN